MRMNVLFKFSIVTYANFHYRRPNEATKSPKMLNQLSSTGFLQIVWHAYFIFRRKLCEVSPCPFYDISGG